MHHNVLCFLYMGKQNITKMLIYAIQHNSIQTPDENCLGMAEYGG